jgi:hypothetical protein
MEPLGSELFRQSAASYERTFWVPSTDKNGKETIVRDRRVQSFPEYLEIEDGCTLGLQQGELYYSRGVGNDLVRYTLLLLLLLLLLVVVSSVLLNGLELWTWIFLGMIEEAFLRDMERNGLRATRSFSFKSYTIDSNSNDDHPVTVELTKGPTTEGGKDGGEVTTVKCKYLVGCDGGRSAVRQFGIENHGLSFEGELLSTLWGAGDFGE